MTANNIEPDDLEEAVRRIAADQPVHMVNLLRFRPIADYGSQPIAGSTVLAPLTGRDVYLSRYLPAFNEVMAPHGASELVFAGIVAARVVGPASANWDAIAVVTYPSMQVFDDLVRDPVYLKQAAPHRLAALLDWQLFATTSL